MTHFNNTTGKNIGEVQISKLAHFFDKNEATIRSLKKTNPIKFERELLGALCQANNISKNILETILNKGLDTLSIDEINALRKKNQIREQKLQGEYTCYIKDELNNYTNDFIEYKSFDNANEEVTLLNELSKRENKQHSYSVGMK